MQPAAGPTAEILNASAGPAAFGDIDSYLHAASRNRYIPEKLAAMPIPSGVDRQIKGVKIKDLPSWSGTASGPLADHYAEVAKLCYLVPDLPSHFTYLIYSTLRGKALHAVDRQNLTLAKAGKQMMHTWGTATRGPRASCWSC